mmetsp:Transcript_1672/g.5576  ORF Transcript_1672/g.5576 Transcript_1672/m.5576 type:complete len:103 (+) Transcript_1672:26-334(+)
MASMLARRSLAELTRASMRQEATGVRHMSGGSYKEELANTTLWRNVTFVGLPCIIGLAGYIFSQGHHHPEEQPAYSYLNIRNKEFPWGKCNLFDKLSGKCEE